MITGISRMRENVTRLGALSGITSLPALRAASCARLRVKVLVDALGQRPADSRHLGDVVDRRGLHAAQSAERLDQRLAALGADAGNLVQHRSGARLAAARAVAEHREAMRLVADLLDQMQSGMRRR